MGMEKNKEYQPNSMVIFPKNQNLITITDKSWISAFLFNFCF